jgi:sugar O-acyltransferase (sialic acid O-acetyltransferase NeuD family)
VSKPLIVIGSGGHASVLVDLLHQQKRDIQAIVSPEKPKDNIVFDDIIHLYKDDDILTFESDKVLLVNGIGSLPGNNLRKIIFDKFSALGYEFETIISDNAIVSKYAKFCSGCQIMAGAIIQANVTIGSNTIINTGATVDHDCRLGKNNHIAPGATLSGMVTTGSSVHIGTGASLIQNIKIEENSIIGAGATITKNIGKNTICYPARNKEKAL